jgi:uroporphyrinogen-III synthase
MIYILSDKQIDGAESISLIQFDYKRVSIDIDKYDAIIFTSRNGVNSLDKIDPSGKWKSKDIYSIGSATTLAIESFGAEIAYQAKKYYADDFSKELTLLLKNKKTLYPRAKVVVSSLVDELRGSSIDIDDIVTYETYCNDKQIELQKGSAIIFSSPSTIECFFRLYEWDSSFVAIAIGTKTAEYIPSHIKYYISSQQTLQASVEYAKELLQKTATS